MLTIERHRFDELDAGRRETLRQLASAEFDRFPIVRKTAWAVPAWSFLGMQHGQLACFHHLVLRQVRFDGQPVQVAGLNNLVTLPACRGQGLATRLLEETTPAWFDALGALRPAAVRRCAGSLLPSPGLATGRLDGALRAARRRAHLAGQLDAAGPCRHCRRTGLDRFVRPAVVSGGKPARPQENVVA
jgi:GNAT superfamily N-acetyltransferase